MLASRIVLISEMKERYSMAVDFSSFFFFFLVFDFCFASKWFYIFAMLLDFVGIHLMIGRRYMTPN